VDLCDQRGAISGLSLLPPLRGRVADYEIFTARELYYPLLLNRSSASAVAWPEAVAAERGSASSASSVPPARHSSPASGTSLPAARKPGKGRKTPPKTAAASGTKGGDQKLPPQQPPQQPQQQPPATAADRASSSSAQSPRVSFRGASGDASMQEASIKDFVHPLLIKLFRPGTDAGEATTGANVSRAVRSESHSILKVGATRKSPSTTPTLSPSRSVTRGISPKRNESAVGVSLQPSAVSGAGASATKNTNAASSTTKATAFSATSGLPLRPDGSSRLDAEAALPDEEEEVIEEPAPTGVKMLIERAERKLTEELVAQMTALLEERELDEKDKEVLENTRLTTGVKVLLPLRDQFTESCLAEFLETLWASCLEMRMFEEEQMILQMPIFQIPPVEEPEEESENGLAQGISAA